MTNIPPHIELEQLEAKRQQIEQAINRKYQLFPKLDAFYQKLLAQIDARLNQLAALELVAQAKRAAQWVRDRLRAAREHGSFYDYCRCLAALAPCAFDWGIPDNFAVIEE